MNESQLFKLAHLCTSMNLLLMIAHLLSVQAWCLSFSLLTLRPHLFLLILKTFFENSKTDTSIQIYVDVELKIENHPTDNVNDQGSLRAC